MTFNPGMPLLVELALFALAVVVLLAGIVRRAPREGPSSAPRGGPAGTAIGWVTLAGLVAIFGLTFLATEGASILRGSFVQDSLAIFAKRLFIASAALSVLGSLTMRHDAFIRRAAEYHFALVVSLLGMSILASARELVLLFVAFELMSIPLFLLTGFLKRDAVAPEAALKFFLVGTASSAVIVYGMSFVYGITGSTAFDAIPSAMAEGHPLMLLGMALLLGGLGFKIAAFPFHMWAPDTYEAASTPFVAWLSVAPKAAGFIAIIRLFVEGVGGAALIWLPAISVLAGMTIVAGNLMAIPQQNIKRMLAYSGIAHIGYMLVGLAALSSSGVAMMLFYLVAYMFGNMGAFLVVEVVARSEQSDGIDAYRGLGTAFTAARAGDADLSAVAGRYSVRGRLLGQAVRLLGRDRARPLRPGPPRRRADRRGVVLLPAGGAPHLYRGARAPRPRRDPRSAGRRDRSLPDRGGRHGPLSRPLGDHGHAHRGHAVLGGRTDLERPLLFEHLGRARERCQACPPAITPQEPPIVAS